MAKKKSKKKASTKKELAAKQKKKGSPNKAAAVKEAKGNPGVKRVKKSDTKAKKNKSKAEKGAAVTGPAKPTVHNTPLKPQPAETYAQEPTGADLTGFEDFTDDGAWIEPNASEGLTEPFRAYSEAGVDDNPAHALMDLPVIPDGWRINVEEDLDTLVFTDDGTEIVNVPLSETFLESFLPVLNKLHLSKTEAATSWEIRLPEDSDQPPVFSLIKNGAVAASLPLSEDIMESLAPAIHAYDIREPDPETTRRARLRAWMGRHKFWSTVLLIILVPIAGYLLFAIGQQIFFTVNA